MGIIIECPMCGGNYEVHEIGNFVIKYTCIKCGYYKYSYK